MSGIFANRFAKAAVCVALIGSISFLSGCEGQKGKGFVGTWKADDAHKSSLLIRYDDGLYHVDKKSVIPFFKGVHETKMEGKAISDNVLSVSAGLFTVNMRLENNQIMFDGDTYKRE